MPIVLETLKAALEEAVDPLDAEMRALAWKQIAYAASVYLERYGQHLDYCPEDPCECGYQDTLNAMLDATEVFEAVLG